MPVLRKNGGAAKALEVFRSRLERQVPTAGEEMLAALLEHLILGHPRDRALSAPQNAVSLMALLDEIGGLKEARGNGSTALASGEELELYVKKAERAFGDVALAHADKLELAKADAEIAALRRDKAELSDKLDKANRTIAKERERARARASPAIDGASGAIKRPRLAACSAHECPQTTNMHAPPTALSTDFSPLEKAELLKKEPESPVVAALEALPPATEEEPLDLEPEEPPPKEQPAKRATEPPADFDLRSPSREEPAETGAHALAKRPQQAEDAMEEQAMSAKRSRQVDVERTDDDAMGEASREGPMLPELSQSVVWYNGQEPTANLDASAGIHSMLQYTTPGKKGETAVPHAPFQTVSGPFRPVEAAPSTLFSALPLFHARHSMPPGVSAAT